MGFCGTQKETCKGPWKGQAPTCECNTNQKKGLLKGLKGRCATVSAGIGHCEYCGPMPQPPAKEQKKEKKQKWGWEIHAAEEGGYTCEDCLKAGGRKCVMTTVYSCQMPKDSSDSMSLERD